MEKDDVPQLSQKDLEMAEKVSKYNVSLQPSHSFSDMDRHIISATFLKNLHFELRTKIFFFFLTNPL